MRSTLTRWLILAIVVLGGIIRLYGYPHVPLSLTRDEMALGYNAYSLALTGHDEWQQSWPITFRSFGDIKLPGYIYALVPLVRIFGLNDWVTRLPSLLAGIIIIPIVYVLAKQLIGKDLGALLSALVLAVSPWAVHYSTTAFEANLALCLFLGWLVLTLGENNTWRKTVVSGLLLLLSILTYNAPLVLAPIVLCTLLILRRVSFVQLSIFGLIIVAAALLVVPASAGKTGISLWTNPGMLLASREYRVQHPGSLVARVITNPYVYILPQVLKNQIQAFEPFFVVRGLGPNPWHQLQGFGHLSVEIYVLGLLGVLGLCSTVLRHIPSLRSKHWREAFLLALVLIGPVPASLTLDAPHATRSLLLFVALSVSCGWIVQQLWNRVRSRQFAWGTIAVILFCCVQVVLGVVLVYRRNALKAEQYQPEWMVGIREICQKATGVQGKVAVLGDVHYMYMYLLYANVIAPSEFWSSVQRDPADPAGLYRVRSFGKFVFFNDLDEIPAGIPYHIHRTKSGSFELAGQ